MTRQLYEARITATGEVRDAEGNLKETVPIETTLTLTHEQAVDLGLITDTTKEI